MRSVILISLVLVVSTSAAAATAVPGTAQHFLDRANRLKAKGPLALFDTEYKRLKSEAVAAGKAIAGERRAAERANRPVLYCSPTTKAELNSSEFLKGLEAIPPQERQSITLKAAMLRILQKKYPCRG